MSELLDLEKAASRLGTSVRFLRRLVAERRIPFHKLGKHVRISSTDLEAFIAAGRVEPLTREPRSVRWSTTAPAWRPAALPTPRGSGRNGRRSASGTGSH